MAKRLQDMTLEELWGLFPITFQSHCGCWAEWAEQEMAFLLSFLGTFHPLINHIGSTAIANIKAKPIIDILVEVPEDVDYNLVRITLEAHGFICMDYHDSRMSFNKGYTPEGYAERVFHIHVHRRGDNAEIRFRDYLRSHPDVAAEYEHLKLELADRFAPDRDAYTQAKSDFVKKYSSIN